MANNCSLDDLRLTLYDLTDESVRILRWDRLKSPLLIAILTIFGAASVCGKMLVIDYVQWHAPKKRPINTFMLFDQAILLLTSLVYIPMVLVSMGLGVSLVDLIGPSGCKVFWAAMTLHGCSLVSGGFVMALLRVWIIKWQADSNEARSMLRKCILLEMAILLGFFILIGASFHFSRTALAIEFCHGRSSLMNEAINGIQEETMALGLSLYTMTMVGSQLLIVCEMFIYVFLYLTLKKHNQVMSMTGALSTQVISERHKKNVVTMSGQAITFFVEIVVSIVIQILISYRGYQILEPAAYPLWVIIMGGFVSISHVWSSPELRRFYNIQ